MIYFNTKLHKYTRSFLTQDCYMLQCKQKTNLKTHSTFRAKKRTKLILLNMTASKQYSILLSSGHQNIRKFKNRLWIDCLFFK